jgi:hypothetical protein
MCVAAIMTVYVGCDRISDIIVTTKYGPLRGNRVRQDYGLDRGEMGHLCAADIKVQGIGHLTWLAENADRSNA